jgi:hypothetical protein
MASWIVRKDLDGDCTAAPLHFEEGSPVMRIPGVLSLEEFAAQQLGPGERLRPGDGVYWIEFRGARVGYFDVFDSRVRLVSQSLSEPLWV